MDSERKTREQLLLEVDALRRRLSEADERRIRAENALRSLEHRNRLLVDSAPFGILTADLAGRITDLNCKIREMLPLPTDQDLTPTNIFEFKLLKEAGIVEKFHQCVQTRTPITANYFLAASQGEGSHLRLHLSPVLDEAGTVTGVLAFLEDITHQNSAEEALRESEERYRLLFQYCPIALIEWDASQLKARIEQLQASGITDFSDYLHKNRQEAAHCMSMIKTVAFNQAFLKLLEADKADQLNAGLYPTDPDEFYRMAQEVILMISRGDVSRERERVIFTLKGRQRNVLVKSIIVSGHEDTLARIIISLVDISERKRAEEALRISEQKFREQALRDNLTGLYNRRYLYKSLLELIEDSKANRSPLSLIFMDLDNFKHVVDTHGHLNGSQAIHEVAATLRDSIKEPGYAVAYAGDEFVVVLPGSNQSQAMETACSIQFQMNNTVYLREQGLAVKLSASFGLATFPDHATDATDLLAAADQILFAIKGKGKNAIGMAGISKP